MRGRSLLPARPLPLGAACSVCTCAAGFGRSASCFLFGLKPLYSTFHQTRAGVATATPTGGAPGACRASNVTARPSRAGGRGAAAESAARRRGGHCSTSRTRAGAPRVDAPLSIPTPTLTQNGATTPSCQCRCSHRCKRPSPPPAGHATRPTTPKTHTPTGRTAPPRVAGRETQPQRRGRDHRRRQTATPPARAHAPPPPPPPQ